MEYMNLHIIATGGTFEKHYDEITGELVFTSSHIPAMMERARVSQSYTFQELTMLDSLDMQDADRENILKSCREIPADRIVIVHGTDTMQDTAAVLGKAALEKTIVLTGAMIPYEFDRSDAFFNLGFAVSAVQLLPTGVYILMNGQIFKWNKVTKNRPIGVFEAVS
ncbi:Glutaminase-asparaginase [Oxalobacter formigenes]|nr:Glutaminase-asparaginase [Oxalobacter formigenes]